ncbi:MAG: T9SS type A sorting domain-containing protein [Bacteroidia bacterium]|nr:T9SS type A sorting domain-containing protein [Bacteroidia bacterium]
MKKIYTTLLTLLIFMSLKSFSQGTFCDSTGNVVIFSNYDGGTLRINVDRNIPNLKIGIVGYENDSVILSGAYLGNVTQVIFAGYFNSNNMHCSPWPSVKSINGVSAAITQINFLPAVTYANPNGYSTVVCNYSCDVNSNQGGCNTADQIAGYFFTQFGSFNLMFHFTQYGCWTGTYYLSDGGNCCAVPLGTDIRKNREKENISVSPNPSSGKFKIKYTSLSSFSSLDSEIIIYDVLGNTVFRKSHLPVAETEIDLASQPEGIYLLKILNGKETVTKKIILN